MPRLRRCPVFLHAARIIRQMFGSVPSVLGHIYATAEGYAVVRHDDLLMVACAERMMAVQREVDPFTVERGQHRSGQNAPRRHQKRPVPFEHVYLEFLIPVQDFLDKLIQPIGEPVTGQTILVTLAGHHFNLEIEVPADQKQLRLRCQHDRPHQPEIVGCIHDQSEFIGPGDPPMATFVRGDWRFAGVVAHSRPSYLGSLQSRSHPFRLTLCQPPSRQRPPQIIGTLFLSNSASRLRVLLPQFGIWQDSSEPEQPTWLPVIRFPI